MLSNEANSPTSFHRKIQDRLRRGKLNSFGSFSKGAISKFVGPGADSPTDQDLKKQGLNSGSNMIDSRLESPDSRHPKSQRDMLKLPSIISPSKSQRHPMKLPYLASPTKSNQQKKFDDWSTPQSGSHRLKQETPISNSSIFRNKLPSNYTSIKKMNSDTKMTEGSQVSLEAQSSVKSFRSNRVVEGSRESRLKPSAFVIKSNKSLSKVSIDSCLPKNRRNKQGEVLSKFAQTRK